MKNKKSLILAALLLAGSSMVMAQYCPTKEGTRLYYKSFDAEENETVTDSAYIDKVTEKDGCTIVSQQNYLKNTHSFSPDSTETTTYVYDHRNLTKVILMSGDMYNQLLLEIALKHAGQDKRAEMEADMKEFQKHICAKGDITLPLKQDATTGESFADCAFDYKIKFMKMSTRTKDGKYEGFETIRTPAGEFHCLKISYVAKAKIMFMAETAYITEWYAPHVGLVKSEEKTKKGKLTASKELINIAPAT